MYSKSHILRRLINAGCTVQCSKTVHAHYLSRSFFRPILLPVQNLRILGSLSWPLDLHPYMSYSYKAQNNLRGCLFREDIKSNVSIELLQEESGGGIKRTEAKNSRACSHSHHSFRHVSSMTAGLISLRSAS